MPAEVARELIRQWREWAAKAEEHPGPDASLTTGYVMGLREAARGLEMAVES